MPLKTLVKVGSITNLSDARYCAGMGVDMLGFNAIAGTPNYVPPALFQDIRGWISGPAIVAEVYGADTQTLKNVIQDYQPQFLECNPATFEKVKEQTTLPFLISLSGSDATTLSQQSNIRYLIVNETTLATLTSGAIQVFVRPSSAANVTTLLTLSNVNGFALTGSDESRPGFKDYEDLSEILEMLDE
jgi:phosphoribosylanthranilate isomerase